MNKNGEHWLKHSICVHPFKKLDHPDEYGNHLKTVHDHWHTVKVFDFPSRITKKWAWFIDYYVARIKVRYPRHTVSHRVCGYWPEAEADMETQKKRKISAAKAQVSKVLGVMEQRRLELSKQLFQDEENDPIMKMAKQKLEEKKFKLNQILNE